MTQRVKGQELSVLVVRAGVLEDTFTAIQSITTENKLEIIEKGYLGEKTNRHDEIYNGAKGSISMHLWSQAWFRFEKAIIDRAKRITPDVQFNIVETLFFPNGETVTKTYADVHFGGIPKNTNARNDYVEVKLDFASDEEDVALS